MLLEKKQWIANRYNGVFNEEMRLMCKRRSGGNRGEREW
jgi:hypothetical protein